MSTVVSSSSVFGLAGSFSILLLIEVREGILVVSFFSGVTSLTVVCGFVSDLSIAGV